MEYDKLIKYLVKKREDMLKNEYGDNIPANLITPPIGKNFRIIKIKIGLLTMSTTTPRYFWKYNPKVLKRIL